MSATDELRRLLDERGVEYDWTDQRHSVPSCEIVKWWFNDHDHAEFMEYHDGSTLMVTHTSMCHATPEQAIDVTLGTKTCENKISDHFAFKCSECGGAWYGIGWNPRPYPHYCPNCGRRIVKVD